MKIYFRALVLIMLCMALAGCRAEVGGDFEDGGIQYYPPGPEFKQSRKAAKAKSAAADQLPNPSRTAPSPPQR